MTGLRFFALASNTPKHPANATAQTLKRKERTAAWACVVTVTVTGRFPAAARLALPGLMLHMLPEGAPEQLKLTLPLNPLLETSDKL
jgi:hypothetical protein